VGEEVGEEVGDVVAVPPPPTPVDRPGRRFQPTMARTTTAAMAAAILIEEFISKGLHWRRHAGR
jgi:hypothetical protein